MDQVKQINRGRRMLSAEETARVRHFHPKKARAIAATPRARTTLLLDMGAAPLAGLAEGVDAGVEAGRVVDAAPGAVAAGVVAGGATGVEPGGATVETLEPVAAGPVAVAVMVSEFLPTQVASELTWTVTGAEKAVTPSESRISNVILCPAAISAFQVRVWAEVVPRFSRAAALTCPPGIMLRKYGGRPPVKAN